MTELEFLQKHKPYAISVANIYKKKYKIPFEFEDLYQNINLYLILAFRRDNDIDDTLARIVMNQACIDLGRSVDKLYASNAYRRWRETKKEDELFQMYKQCLWSNMVPYDDFLMPKNSPIEKNISQREVVELMVKSIKTSYLGKPKLSKERVYSYTKRDLEILSMFLNGYNNAEITEEYGFSPGRVSQILNNAIKDVRSQIEHHKL